MLLHNSFTTKTRNKRYISLYIKDSYQSIQSQLSSVDNITSKILNFANKNLIVLLPQFVKQKFLFVFTQYLYIGRLR